MKLYLLSLFFVASNFIIANDDFEKNKTDKEKIEECVEKIFASISPEKIIDMIIANEKSELVKTILANYQKKEKKVKISADDHFFIPSKPEPSLNKPQFKNVDTKATINQRINQRYIIHEMPGQIKNVIGYFSNHDELKQKNVKIFNRVLLHGKPGAGKTHLVKVLSDELQVPLLKFSASFFADKYIGESSRRIRMAFDVVKKHEGPIFIFIDEIDALAPKRSENMHQEHRATLMTLLTELQDLQENPNVFIFTATNDEAIMDPALKDRFACAICEIKPLDKKGRGAIIQYFFAQNGVRVSEDFAFRLGEVMFGFTNRELQYVVTTALLKFNLAVINKTHDDKSLAFYVREAIVESGKKGDFVDDRHQKYGYGI